MTKPIVLSRTPFRISLGGGSTDLPSYYEKYGGFIFAVTIDRYMDIFIKEPVSDDLIHMHYMKHEEEPSVNKIKHSIGRQALLMRGIKNKLLVFFSADTPAGTGLGSSGACSVGLLKGIALYQGEELSNEYIAEKSFELTQRLGLPDGKQDPYVCAMGGFVVLEIGQGGIVSIEKPQISSETTSAFFNNSLFFYTGIRRHSEPLLVAQADEEVITLKHETKKIGREIYQCFLEGDLNRFGLLMDDHWNIKKSMASGMSSNWLDEIYKSAKDAGTLGGKIMGAGGGGYFMFYCGSEKIKDEVKNALKKYNLQRVNFFIDKKGARAKTINL